MTDMKEVHVIKTSPVDIGRRNHETLQRTKVVYHMSFLMLTFGFMSKHSIH